MSLAPSVFAQSFLSGNRTFLEQAATLPEFLQEAEILAHPSLEQTPDPSALYAPIASFRETLVGSASLDFLNFLNLIEDDLPTAQAEFQYFQYALASEERLVVRIRMIHALKNYRVSEILAQNFLKNFRHSRYESLVYYLYSQARFFQGKSLDKNPVAHEVLFTYAPPRVQSSFLRMLSQEALQQNLLLSAIGYLLDELENPSTQNVTDTAPLLKLLKQIKHSDTLELIQEFYSDLRWGKQIFPQVMLPLLLKEQQYARAFQLLYRELAIAHVTHNQKRVLELEALKKEVNNALKVNPYRIGVLLPLSSKNPKIARLTRQTVEGLRLALYAPLAPPLLPTVIQNKDSLFLSQKVLKQFLEQNAAQILMPNPSKELLFPQPEDPSKTPWELVFRDSELDAKKTELAVKDLVEQENVIAIIGPLTRKTSEAAAQAAQSYKVPLISLSLTSSIPDLGDYVFRNNQNWQEEIRALIRFAVDYKQAHRFAILYANNRDGRKKMRFFWKEIEAQGHLIHAVESFKPHQKNFVKEFDGITGKNRFVSAEEQQWMQEWKEKQTPINNFDAVFIVTGNGNTYDLKILFPYVAVYQWEKMLLLGDSTWNQKTMLFAPGQLNLNNALFVDNFFPQSSDFEVKKFMNLHKQKFFQHRNYKEPTAYTAYAYDTARLLFSLLQDESKHSRQDLRDSLLKMPPYAGVTSSFRFQKNGEVQRILQKLTFRRNRIVPAF